MWQPCLLISILHSYYTKFVHKSVIMVKLFQKVSCESSWWTLKPANYHSSAVCSSKVRLREDILHVALWALKVKM